MKSGWVLLLVVLLYPRAAMALSQHIEVTPITISGCGPWSELVCESAGRDSIRFDLAIHWTGSRSSTEDHCRLLSWDISAVPGKLVHFEPIEFRPGSRVPGSLPSGAAPHRAKGAKRTPTGSRPSAAPGQLTGVREVHEVPREAVMIRGRAIHRSGGGGTDVYTVVVSRTQLARTTLRLIRGDCRAADSYEYFLGQFAESGGCLATR